MVLTKTEDDVHDIDKQKLPKMDPIVEGKNRIEL